MHQKLTFVLSKIFHVIWSVDWFNVSNSFSSSFSLSFYFLLFFFILIKKFDLYYDGFIDLMLHDDNK